MISVQKFLLICFLLTGLNFHLLAQQKNPPEWPAVPTGEKPVCHLAYCFLYAEKHEQALWVAYELTAEETLKSYERSNKFLEDPKVSTGSASNEDYSRSGFDRGHLAPAADMGWSQQSMEESFYFSNMSPQRPECNRGIWKKGEEQVRDWAREYGKLLVVTGPVLREGLPSIGPNQVSVPEFYYKVLLHPDPKNSIAMAFIIPNHGSSNPLQSFAVPIDSVEKISGLDFFPLLPDAQEKKLEAENCTACWNWGKTPAPIHRTGSESKNSRHENQSAAGMSESDPYRCHGITRKGERCKRRVKKEGINCYQHGG